MVKSFTVGVDEKNETMNNGDVTLDNLLLILHSPPSFAVWMGEAVEVASSDRNGQGLARSSESQ